MKPDTFRVHAPSTIVFLCGGVIDGKLGVPTMLRDAFYRLSKTVPLPYQIVLAERADPLTTDAGYEDLFSFESDIAQVVGLIVLFVESAGSIAELGAFAAIDTVAPSLLAVMNDFFYGEKSFIKHGPVKFLENKYGEEWIVQLDRKEVGIADNGIDISGLKSKEFSEVLFPVIEKRLKNRPIHTRFDRENNGHCILLVVGLCQIFGALTQSEISVYLSILNVVGLRFKSIIYCATLLGWIVVKRKSNHIYIVATPGEPALDFAVHGIPKDKDRWKSDIRAYWRDHERPRHNAISEVITAPLGAGL